MADRFESMSFGEAVCALRKDKGWTVKDFIQKLEEKGYKAVSAGYITRIEQYAEIPAPELILTIAEVFKADENKLLECAKKVKVEKFDKSLEEKYQKALGHYRTQKKAK